MRATYLYHAYSFERARSYASKHGGEPDPNDFEDAHICLHLGLDQSTTLVTNDRGTLAALQSAIERLERVDTPCCSGVMTCEGFKDAASA